MLCFAFTLRSGTFRLAFGLLYIISIGVELVSGARTYFALASLLCLYKLYSVPGRHARVLPALVPNEV